ncbi:FkbM family methyltransferase [Erythrobacter sp. NE805]|uniref:FkbM family methyltransferase n=1 Tax=Erythrobacter sp. NE805 TaxID=3389875 RepID=UPI00396AF839
MPSSLRAVVRSLQAEVPGLWNNKHRVYKRLIRHFGLMMEPEFALLSRIGPVGLVLDIGANYGQSIEAIRRCCRPARIVSFEPLSVLAEGLVRDFGADGSVRIENCALGDAPGELTLHVPRYGGAVLDGLASTDRASITAWLENPALFWNFRPEKLAFIENRVPVRTLDSFGLAPDAVKIDVQGMELAVVEGGIETFRACQPLTIVEDPTDELVALFRSIGMEPYGYSAGRLTGEWRGRTNTVFLGAAMKARLGL